MCFQRNSHEMVWNYLFFRDALAKLKFGPNVFVIKPQTQPGTGKVKLQMMNNSHVEKIYSV